MTLWNEERFVGILIYLLFVEYLVLIINIKNSSEEHLAEPTSTLRCEPLSGSLV